MNYFYELCKFRGLANVILRPVFVKLVYPVLFKGGGEYDYRKLFQFFVKLYFF